MFASLEVFWGREVWGSMGNRPWQLGSSCNGLLWIAMAPFTLGDIKVGFVGEISEMGPLIR